jgi:hypothetical protein
MGLLDDAMQNPWLNLGVGLLSASGPSNRPVGLGQALMGGMGQLNIMQELARRKKEAEARQAAQELQAEESQIRMDQLRQQVAQQKALEAWGQKLVTGGFNRPVNIPAAAPETEDEGIGVFNQRLSGMVPDQSAAMQELLALNPGMVVKNYAERMFKVDEPYTLKENEVRMAGDRVIARGPQSGIKPTDNRKKMNELIEDGMNPEVAKAIAYGFLEIVPTADGGTAIVRKDLALSDVGGKSQQPGIPQSGFPRVSPQEQAARDAVGKSLRDQEQGKVPTQPWPSLGQLEGKSPYAPSARLPGQIGGTTGSKPQEALNKDVNALSDSVAKAKIPQFDSIFGNIDKVLTNYVNDQGKPSGDIPGYGRFAGLLPTAMVSEQGKVIRQAMAPLRNLTLLDRSGAAVTNPEFERLKEELGSGAFMTDEDLLRGYTQIKAMYEANRANIMAGAAPEVQKEYMARNPKRSTISTGGWSAQEITR